MGLEVETLEESRRFKAVANYVRARGGRWESWLQTRRVELDAMTTPQLIDWLDRKMLIYGNGKLIPPTDVLEQELAEQIERRVRADITERILREADIDAQVTKATAAIRMPDGAKIERDIKRMFERKADAEWRNHIAAIVRKIS